MLLQLPNSTTNHPCGCIYFSTSCRSEIAANEQNTGVTFLCNISKTYLRLSVGCHCVPWSLLYHVPPATKWTSTTYHYLWMHEALIGNTTHRSGEIVWAFSCTEMNLKLSLVPKAIHVQIRYVEAINWCNGQDYWYWFTILCTLTLWCSPVVQQQVGEEWQECWPLMSSWCQGWRHILMIEHWTPVPSTALFRIILLLLKKSATLDAKKGKNLCLLVIHETGLLQVPRKCTCWLDSSLHELASLFCASVCLQDVTPVFCCFAAISDLHDVEKWMQPQEQSVVLLCNCTSTDEGLNKARKRLDSRKTGLLMVCLLLKLHFTNTLRHLPTRLVIVGFRL